MTLITILVCSERSYVAPHSCKIPQLDSKGLLGSGFMEGGLEKIPNDDIIMLRLGAIVGT